MQTIGWIDATEKTDDKTPTTLQVSKCEMIFL